MNLDQVKSVHCLGIGGIGVSGLARLFLAMGKTVSGSDIKPSEITASLEKLGVKVSIGSNTVEGHPDLVIYTSAVPAEDLDKIQAPKFSHGEAMGELMKGRYGIGVTGTNGKSTTTLLLGLMLDQAGLDPSVLVGTMLLPVNETSEFKANARAGLGKYFVAEADEYQAKMLLNKPQMIIVTNIAEDHLDYYRDLEDIKAAFLKYALSLPADGVVIYNADDHNTVEVCRQAKCHKLTFGIKHYADLQAINWSVKDGRQTFDLHLSDEKIGEFEMFVPGEFNVSNALAASMAAIKLGVPTETIKKTLFSFRGSWRRFEQVGLFEGKPIVSDYAHHPAGVAGTIQAAKEFYPGKKILVVFQPHHRNRTQKLFADFVEALTGADYLIVPEIFDVTGREHGEAVSSAQLVEELQKAGVKAEFAKNLDETGEKIRAQANEFDVILMMGAGDIDTLARKLVGN